MLLFVVRLLVAAGGLHKHAGWALEKPAPGPSEGLGPGRQEWTVVDPSKYGLSRDGLAAAADAVGAAVPERGCLLITKGGEIILEEYYGYSADTRWETDSMAKTFAAALFGVVVEKGLLDLDKPLAEYGMPPFALWNYTGVDFWPNVTARHLLTQTSGYGVVPPGTKMTYDSNLYIQHLSHFLSHIRYSAQHFATHFFAKPLGVPDLYLYDSQRWPELANEISVGGGQMVTCREAARIGQFVLNRGMWRDSLGAPVRLGNEDYFRQMLAPAYPGVVDGYGFLTWLNVDQSKNTSKGEPRSHCCGPRFGGNRKVCNKQGSQCAWCCVAQASYKNSSLPCDVEINSIDPTYKQANLSGASMYVGRQIVGDDLADPPDSPENMAIGFGQYAKYMLLLPDENMQVISMGMSYGKSLNCPTAYNDMTSLAFLWAPLRKALQLEDSNSCETLDSCVKVTNSVGSLASASVGSESLAQVIADDLPTLPTQWRTRRHRHRALAATPKTPVRDSLISRIWTAIFGIWSFIASMDSFLPPRQPEFPPPAPPIPPKPDENLVVGSCYCGCPPDLLVGTCFNVKKDVAPADKNCNKVRVPRVDALAAVCPTIGLVLQCDPAVYKPEAMCSNQTLQGQESAQKLNIQLEVGG